MNRTTTRAAQMAAVLAAVVAAATGCTSTGGEPTTEPQEGVNRPADGGDSPADLVDADTGGDPEAFANDPGALPGVLAYGETYTYDDGLQITVTGPHAFTPSQTFEEFGTDDAPHYVSFEVTVVNGTDAVHEPAGFYTTAQSANAEATETFDFDGGLEGAPQTPLLPGREASFTIGYGVVDPADVVLQVQPGGVVGYAPLLYAPGTAE